MEKAAADVYLDKLLSGTSGDVTLWVLKQFRELSQTNVDLETSACYYVAVHLRNAPVDRKARFIQMALRGIAELPHSTRLEVIWRFIHLAPSIGQGSLSGSSSSASDASVNSMETPAMYDPEELANLLRNCSTLAYKCDYNALPEEEKKSISRTANDEAGSAIRPLLEVVPTLTRSERVALSNAFVQAGYVSRERQATIERAFRLGGHVDKLARLLRGCLTLPYFHWLAFVSSLAELVCLGAFAFVASGNFLETWLALDFVLSTLVLSAARAFGDALQPIAKELGAHPVQSAMTLRHMFLRGIEILGASQRVQELRNAMRVANVLTMFVGVNAVWAVIGVATIATATWCGSVDRTVLNVVVCGFFVGLRLGTISAVWLIIVKARDQLARMQFQMSIQESSQP